VNGSPGRYVLRTQIPISRNEGTMAGTQQQHSDLTYVVNRRGQHVHHGRTLAAWAGSAVALLAFILGAVAVVIQFWPLFWASVALAAVALIVTVVLQRMGYGAN
jgi:predicted phage tail protein